MLQTRSRVFQIRRQPLPCLHDELRVKLYTISLSELAIDGLGKDFWPVGHEAAIYCHFAHSLVIDPPASDTLAFFGVDYEPRVGANFTARPPSELGAFAAWQAVAKEQLDPPAVININRVLGGSEELRRGHIATTPFRSGHKVLFDCSAPPEEFLAEWVNAFAEPCESHHVVTRAIWLFVDFLIAHPFRDGNGRTARLLFQTFLHAKGFLPAPLLPLYPALLVNQRAFLSAVWAWELRANPTELFQFMYSLITKTKEVSKQQIAVLSKSTGEN